MLTLVLVGLLIGLNHLNLQPISAQTDPERPLIRVGVIAEPQSQIGLGATLAVQGLNASPSQAYRYELIFSDADDLNPENLSAIISLEAEVSGANGLPILSLSTADGLALPPNTFRVRTAERFMSYAIVDYLRADLGLTQLALIQTDVPSTLALLAAESRLADFDLLPSAKIQLVDNSELQTELSPLIDAPPQAILFWGAPEDAAFTQNALRAEGWEGVFYYPQALERLQDESLSLEDTQGMLGASAWVYSNQDARSGAFLAAFVAQYATLPTDEAAAAYDALSILAWVWGQVGDGGQNPQATLTVLRNIEAFYGLQGRMQPAAYADGDLSRSVSLYEITPYGSPRPLARYENTSRLLDSALSENAPDLVAMLGAPTSTPDPMPDPTAAPMPSPTPSQLQLRVIAPSAEVWSRPDRLAPLLGELPNGASATIIGGDATLDWLVIQYRNGLGWIPSNPQLIEIFDPASLLSLLPVIAAPPIEDTAAGDQAQADIIIENVLLDPPQPIPGQAFVASVILSNVGGAPTGPFTVATSFEPGAVYSSNNVANIDPGSTLTVPLSATVVGTGDFAIDIVADISNTVPEGPAGEQNNRFRLSYRVDFNIVAQADGLALSAGESLTLIGEQPNLAWSGVSLDAQNGTLIGVITGLTYEGVNFGALTPEVINNPNGLSDTQIFPGVLIGLITPQGNRAIIRVEARTGTALTLSYRVYGN